MSRARPLSFRRLPDSRSRGIVSIETPVCLPVVLVAFLGVVQPALLSAARIVVHHAANRALRAAVVVLDDDPSRYDDEPRGEVGSSRLDAIRHAAYGPLSTVAASP